MAPSQRSMLALLSLVASIQAAPAALPEPRVPAPRQIGLTPPSFSVSWDVPAPVSTDDPEGPGEPELPFPIPTPSDQISLSPPSYSISWDTGGVPEPTEGPGFPGPIPQPSDQISLHPPSFGISWDTGAPAPGPTDYPEDPEQPGFPVPHPTQSNQISLNPPSYSVSWETPAPPKTTKVPTPPQSTKRPWPPKSTKKPVWPWHPPKPTFAPALPTPSNQISSDPPTYTVSWGKRQDDQDPFPEPTDDPFPEDPQDPEDPENPGGPIVIPPIFPTQPPNSIGILPPQPSISWGKRQEEIEPEPTDEPDPENPGGPIVIPPIFPTQPPNSIGILPPQPSISWGKRQEEIEPEPTSEPDPENPGGPIIIPPILPTPPPNSIGIQPPQPSVSWGKRAPEPETNTYGFITRIIPSFSLGKPILPTVGVSWNKRQDEAEPTDDPVDGFPAPAQPTPSDEIGIQPPDTTIIWGKEKRGADPKPEAQAPSFGFQFPTQSVWWPRPPKPTSAYLSWGKREAEPAPQTNDIGIEPPQATLIWGKEKRDADPEPEAQAPSYGFQFPTQSVWWPRPPKPTSAYLSWGKREAEPAPQTNDIGIEPPQATLIWGKEKRDADPEPEAQAPSYGFQFPTQSVWWPRPPKPTSAYLSWGKREAEPAPQTNDVGIEPPQATIIWGKEKREAEPDANPQLPSFGLGWPTNVPFPSWDPAFPPWYPKPSSASVSWGKRDVDPEPTPPPSEVPIPLPPPRPIPTKKHSLTSPKPIPTLKTSIVPPPLPPQPIPTTSYIPRSSVSAPPSSCPTVTKTIVPPCVPPFCPDARQTPCDYNKPVPKMERKVVEKRIVTIKTVTPIGTPTPIVDGCTKAVTVTVNVGCPTYTCVPWCEAAQVVR